MVTYFPSQYSASAKLSCFWVTDQVVFSVVHVKQVYSQEVESSKIKQSHKSHQNA